MTLMTTVSPMLARSFMIRENSLDGMRTLHPGTDEALGLAKELTGDGASARMPTGSSRSKHRTMIELNLRLQGPRDLCASGWLRRTHTYVCGTPDRAGDADSWCATDARINACARPGPELPCPGAMAVGAARWRAARSARRRRKHGVPSQAGGGARGGVLGVRNAELLRVDVHQLQLEVGDAVLEMSEVTMLT